MSMDFRLSLSLPAVVRGPPPQLGLVPFEARLTFFFQCSHSLEVVFRSLGDALEGG